MASTFLTRTPSSTGSQTKFTLSFWWKNSSKQNSDKCFFSSGSNTSNYFSIETTGTEYIRILNIDNASAVINYKPSRVFRDASAWYHIVIAIDTTQAGGNRVKFYTNGVRETAFDLNVEPNQGANVLYVNDTGVHNIGRRVVTAGNYMDGSMSHFHFIDGTAYDASYFGETDATTGEWKIKTSPSVTYGTNGFFILKDGNSVTDQSGNSNNFTVGGGTLTKTEDCPSNVFATMNALQYSPNTTFSNGNNVVTQSVGGNGARRFTSTLGASSGKYYWETKITGTVNGMTFGIVDGVEGDYNNYVGYKSKEVGYEKDGVIYKNAAAVTTGLTVVALNDVVNHALDLDNGYIYFGVNGTWQNSGVPTSGATGTGGFSITADTLYHPAVSAFANTGQISCNFGNGYFGTTAVASAGTNASGNGIFEYDVPTGYTALSTKGLNL